MALVRLRLLPWLLAIGAIVVVALFSLVTGRSYLARQAAVRETLAAREAMAETLSLMKDAETGGRGFLLTGQEPFLEPYSAAAARVFADLAVLTRLGEANPAQRASARRVNALARQKLEMLGNLIALRRRSQLDGEAMVPMLREGKLVMDSLRVEIRVMLARADARLDERERAAAQVTSRLQLLLGAAFAGGVALALAGLRSARNDADEAHSMVEQLARDVAAREKAELLLTEQSELLESVLVNIGDAVIVLDSERTVLVANPAAQRIANYVVGARLSAAWSKEVLCYLPDGVTVFPPELGPLTRALQGHASDGVEMVIRVLGGEHRSFTFTTRPISAHGITVAAVAVIRDTTALKAARKELLDKSEQLRALSLRDELTGLHNRRGFMEVAEHQLKAAARAEEPCVVFFADLNGMKLINDQLGHEMGDHAIRAAAEILTNVFRSSDVVARLGGDEFAVFAGECDEQSVPSVYAQIEHAVSEFNAEGVNRYRLSLSAGAAVFHPENPRDLATLMQAADANMYDAKRARHQRMSLRVRSV